MNNDFMNMQMDPLARTQLKKNSGVLFAMGVALVIIGSLAIVFALASTLVSVVFLGILLTVLGVLEGVKASHMRLWSTFFLHVAISVLYIVGGLFTIFNPAINALTLTLLLGVFFIVSGTLRVIFAVRRSVPHKGWLLFNGAMSILLGVLICYQWPYSGLWAIGTLIGIEAIFTGWTWIMISSMAKKMPQ